MRPRPLLTRIMDLQLLGLARLCHFVFGEPLPDDEFNGQLEAEERLEKRLGKTTTLGEFLRFQKARREFVATLLQPVNPYRKRK